jgi:hypothetical protein
MILYTLYIYNIYIGGGAISIFVLFNFYLEARSCLLKKQEEESHKDLMFDV